MEEAKMTRHITDHSEPQAEGTRVKAYLDIDRQKGMHPAVRELSKRPASRSEESSKVREYARIERGQET
jgi:hypothetical protein